jgi:hypothetical protein
MRCNHNGCRDVGKRAYDEHQQSGEMLVRQVVYSHPTVLMCAVPAVEGTRGEHKKYSEQAKQLAAH